MYKDKILALCGVFFLFVVVAFGAVSLLSRGGIDVTDKPQSLLSPQPLEYSDATPQSGDSDALPVVTHSTITPTEAKPEKKPLKLLFAGDMMYDRNIRLKMQKPGARFPLQHLEPVFAEYDYVIANLEGPITDNPSRSVGSTPGSTNNFIFTFPTEVAQALYDQNIRIVNLGNNHILNFGTKGAQQTKTYLDQAQVKYFGDTTLEQSSQERTLILEHQDLTLGFVNYNQFVPKGAEHALEDVAWIRPQVDLVIVYTHWGNEYIPTANAPIVKIAHQLVDAGADLVIGSHPHVIQNVEDYQGKRIYYSLGNFVFDQYFSKETQEGLMVSVTVDPETQALSFSEQKVQLQKDGSTVLQQPAATP